MQVNEVSPEREVLYQRKKNNKKPNKESFGIKIKNLNDASKNRSSHTNNEEIKVSDFIEEQRNYGSINLHDSDDARGSNAM